MRKILLSLVLGVLGCAIDPKISRMEFYSKEQKKPIIYGGITGIPDGYDFVLHFEYHDLKGRVKRVSRAFDDKDEGTKDGIFKFTFFLPPGRWTLRQIEMMRMKETGETTLVHRDPKMAMAILQMRDSLETGFTFEVAKAGLYYLGRWQFSGFESLDGLLPEAIARFNASKKKAVDSSRHSISMSVETADSTESDHAYFKRRNAGLGAKKSIPVIPATPIGPKAYAFDLLIAKPESAPHYMPNDLFMKQMMGPRIPHL